MGVRIVERTCVDGKVLYVIQQRHFLFRWWWVDAWLNEGSNCNDCFNTLTDARRNLCYFDGSTSKDKVIETDD